MAKHHVIYVSRYSLTDRQSGQPVSGCKVQYLANDPVNTEDGRGRPALTVRVVDDGLWRKFTELPGFYDLEFAVKPDKTGRPIMQITDAWLLPSDKSAPAPN